jgi:hypothetical protein
MQLAHAISRHADCPRLAVTNPLQADGPLFARAILRHSVALLPGRPISRHADGLLLSRAITRAPLGRPP